MNNQEILKWYNRGFEDELKGSTSVVPDGLALIAYRLGALDAWAGDDCSSVDLQTDEEIIEKIKNHKPQPAERTQSGDAFLNDEEEPVKIFQLKSARASLKDFCVFSMGEPELEDDFLEVIEWRNGDGYEITISTKESKKSISLTKGQYEALVQCIGKLEENF
jgi:hypothetical protein